MTESIEMPLWSLIVILLCFLALGLFILLTVQRYLGALHELSFRRRIVPLSKKAKSAAYDKFWKGGPPGVLRRVLQVDSYPGEYPGDPEAHHDLPTSVADCIAAIEEAAEAAAQVAQEELELREGRR
jgi:hypothetical protein